jgi:hypothetical protein
MILKLCGSQISLRLPWLLVCVVVSMSELSVIAVAPRVDVTVFGEGESVAVAAARGTDHLHGT